MIGPHVAREDDERGYPAPSDAGVGRYMGGAPSGDPLIFISAAEPSADLHGAALIRATRRLRPSAMFVGVGGPKMLEAGCWSIYDLTAHSAMLLGAVGLIARAARMIRMSVRYARRYPFDGAVVLDSPALHLPLAGRLRAAGLPVLYYIAPQLWAWGAQRIHRLRRRTDAVAVILPFEEEYFARRGVNATYVGHPLGDHLRAQVVDAEKVEAIRAGGHPVIALLPGSRKHVVREVFGGQLEVAERIALTFPGATLGVSVAGSSVGGIIADKLARSPLKVDRHPGRHGGHSELIAAADLVLVASGTTTLEVAYHRRPMIVMYNASRLVYQLVGRWMIRTPFLSLPNILAGREIVPEFMPYYTSTAPIADRAIELLQDPAKASEMSAALAGMVEPLMSGEASANAARLLLEMCRSS